MSKANVVVRSKWLKFELFKNLLLRDWLPTKSYVFLKTGINCESVRF